MNSEIRIPWRHRNHRLSERQIERLAIFRPKPECSGGRLTRRAAEQYELRRVTSRVSQMWKEQFRRWRRTAFVNGRRCCDQEIVTLVVAASQTHDRDGSSTRRYSQDSLKWSRRISHRTEAGNLVHEQCGLTISGHSDASSKSRRDAIQSRQVKRHHCCTGRRVRNGNPRRSIRFATRRSCPRPQRTGGRRFPCERQGPRPLRRWSPRLCT